MTESDTDFEMLEKRLSDLDPDELILVRVCSASHFASSQLVSCRNSELPKRAFLQVSSAFSQMLNLHNLSEDISNAQSEKAARMGEVSCLLL